MKWVWAKRYGLIYSGKPKRSHIGGITIRWITHKEVADKRRMHEMYRARKAHKRR